MSKRKTPAVFLVSDGRGNTAKQLAQAALVQFEGASYEMEPRPHVSSPEQVRAIVKEASKSNSVIFYTLVEEGVRKAMRTAFSVGSASVSSNALVWSDWVPPRTAARPW